MTTNRRSIPEAIAVMASRVTFDGSSRSIRSFCSLLWILGGGSVPCMTSFEWLLTRLENASWSSCIQNTVWDHDDPNNCTVPVLSLQPGTIERLWELRARLAQFWCRHSYWSRGTIRRCIILLPATFWSFPISCLMIIVLFFNAVNKSIQSSPPFFIALNLMKTRRSQKNEFDQLQLEYLGSGVRCFRNSMQHDQSIQIQSNESEKPLLCNSCYSKIQVQ